MASYQDQPAYQTYQTNPYQLPVQQIVQAIQTRNQYWDSGATVLKNAYQNYLNLDLSNPANHEKLNGLMQGVTQNLQKASQTDLSLGENYGKALSIFDPIVKDQNIMGDNALTKSYNNEFQKMLAFRTQNGGRDYSDTNMRYLQNGLSAFAQGDPNNWREAYANRRFATPYTDVSAEERQLYKNFKPDMTSITAPMYVDATTGKPVTYDKDGKPSSTDIRASGYLVTNTNKSILSSQYRAYVDANLSDKAKSQLAIDGSVKYNNNPDALARDYSNYNQEKIDSYKQQIARIDAERPNHSPTQQDQDDDLKKNYQNGINELSISNTKLAGRDYSELLPYKEQIAAQVYSNNYIDRLGKDAAEKNIDIKYSPDQTWRTQFQENQENNRFDKSIAFKTREGDLNRQTRIDAALIRAGLKGFNFGQGLPGSVDYNTTDHSNDKNYGLDQYNNEKTQASADFNKAVQVLNSKMGITPKMTPDQVQAANNSFFADPRNKSYVDDYYKAAQLKNVQDMRFAAMDKQVNDELKAAHPELVNAKQNIINSITSGETLRLKEIPPASTDNSFSADVKRAIGTITGTGIVNNLSKPGPDLNLTRDDIQKILNGTHPTISLQKGEDIKTGPLTQTGASYLTMNGKKYSFSSGALGTSSGTGVLANAVNKINTSASDLDAARGVIMNRNINATEGIRNVMGDDKNPLYKAVHEGIIRAIGGAASGDIKPDNVLISKVHDVNGDVEFKINKDANSNINLNEVEAKVNHLGGRKIEKDDAFLIPGKQFGDMTKVNTFSDPRLAEVQKLVDSRAMGPGNQPTAVDHYNIPPMTLGERNFGFTVDVRDGHSTFFIEDPVTGARFGNNDKNTPFETLGRAAEFAAQLGDKQRYPDAIYDNFVRKIGGVPDHK